MVCPNAPVPCRERRSGQWGPARKRMTEENPMSSQAARTPGATRAGPGEYAFDLAKVNKIKGGPDYSSVEGGCVEGDRMIVALMRMPAGTGAEPHSHPNEQWIYVLEGT